MEGAVNGIRERFFCDLTEDYLAKQKESFLYRDFWSEKMQDLLQEHFPDLLKQEPPMPEDAERLREEMSRAMADRPEWARGLLLKEEGWKPRRNIWAELWLNDAGYVAGLITDTEYYLWLAEYLAAHDFFKAGIICFDKIRNRTMLYGHLWVDRLLRAGLGMNRKKLKEAIRARKKSQDKDEKLLSKAEADEALAMLAERIREDRDSVAGRLHELIGRDYLPVLTERLERLALHIDIREWLQNSGYPLTLKDEADKPKKPRKKELTWQRFTAFCDSADGYDFRRKKGGAGWRERTAGQWHLDSEGFCELDTDQEQLEKLMAAHEKEQDDEDEEEQLTYFYLPLAVHLQSGCVFFLAGKSYYERVYQEAKGSKGDALRAKYDSAKARYCFDYMRHDYSGGAAGGSFRLTPAFHVNAGKGYWDILEEFEDYCMSIDRNGPLHRVKKYNGTLPAETPEEFSWAFDARERE